MALAKRRNIDIMLGLFVVVGIFLLVSSIFVIGRERKLFDSSAYIRAQFPNVTGLSVGAQVLLGGFAIGQVCKIEFPLISPTNSLTSQYLTVVMRISVKMMPWIRQDSIVRVDSKGLLGDKTINIGLGSQASPKVKSGEILNSIAPIDFNQALADAQKLLSNVTDILTGARKFFDRFIGDSGDTSLALAMKSLKQIIGEIERGEGLLHQIIYSKSSGQDYKQVFANLSKSLKSMENILGNVDKVIAELENGNGLLHSLVYSEDESNFISSQNKAAKDLEAIMSRLEQGKGTIGRLLNDPSIYDDLRLILGNFKKNNVLKALVKHSIARKTKEDAE